MALQLKAKDEKEEKLQSSKLPPPNKRNESSTHSEDSDNNDDMTVGKRFTSKEKRILFGIIRNDQDLLHSFMHKLKRRIWNGKSWMHEIGTRFNELCPNHRTHDAVRHHLKFRHPVGSTVLNSKVSKNDKLHNISDLIFLLEHAINCQFRDSCARCLQIDRLRVEMGFASCGHPNCFSCDPNLPSVLNDYNARKLLHKIIAMKRVLISCGSTATINEAKQSNNPERCQLMSVPSLNTVNRSQIAKSVDNVSSSKDSTMQDLNDLICNAESAAQTRSNLISELMNSLLMSQVKREQFTFQTLLLPTMNEFALNAVNSTPRTTPVFSTPMFSTPMFSTPMEQQQAHILLNSPTAVPNFNLNVSVPDLSTDMSAHLASVTTFENLNALNPPARQETECVKLESVGSRKRKNQYL